MQEERSCATYSPARYRKRGKILSLCLFCALFAMPMPASAETVTERTAAKGPTHHLVRQTDTELSIEQAEDAKVWLAPVITVEEGGLRGEIPLKDVLLQPLYRSWDGQIDRTVIYQELPTNDVSLLPETAPFIVGSDGFPGATCEKDLRRADVVYEVTGFDGCGIPRSYQATVVYRGAESTLSISSYLAKATYEGDLISSEAADQAEKEAGGGTHQTAAVEPLPDRTAMSPLSLMFHNGAPWILAICGGFVTAFVLVALALHHNHRRTDKGADHV